MEEVTLEQVNPEVSHFAKANDVLGRLETVGSEKQVVDGINGSLPAHAETNRNSDAAPVVGSLLQVSSMPVRLPSHGDPSPRQALSVQVESLPILPASHPKMQTASPYSMMKAQGAVPSPSIGPKAVMNGPKSSAARAFSLSQAYQDANDGRAVRISAPLSPLLSYAESSMPNSLHSRSHRRMSFGDSKTWDGDSSEASGYTGLTGTTFEPSSPFFDPTSPEGRAIKKYMKQPLPIRANVEAWEIDPNEIVIKERMGEGQVGIIHKAKWRGTDVALKTLKEGLSLDGTEHNDLQNELEVLTRHRHPNLVMFIGACTTSEPFMIVCEYMSGGSIESIFMAKKREAGGKPWRPPRQQVVAWCGDLIRALCYLHGSKPMVVHRDLKPSNLLLSSNSTLKVADFGLSRTLRRRRTIRELQKAGLAGTKRYLAPELFAENAKFDEKVDIYACAMIMWYIYMGERPLTDEEADIVAQQALRNESTLRPPVDRITWKPFQNLITQAWKSSPKERPTAEHMMQVLEHLALQTNGCWPKKCVIA